MSSSAEDIQAHVKVYMMVFAALAAFTLITVGLSFVDFGNHSVNIGVGLLIALVKASLVACYFMHLISEKKFLFWILGLTVVFFFVIMLIPVVTENSNGMATSTHVVSPGAAGHSGGH